MFPSIYSECILSLCFISFHYSSLPPECNPPSPPGPGVCTLVISSRSGLGREHRSGRSRPVGRLLWRGWRNETEIWWEDKDNCYRIPGTSLKSTHSLARKSDQSTTVLFFIIVRIYFQLLPIVFKYHFFCIYSNHTTILWFFFYKNLNQFAPH